MTNNKQQHLILGGAGVIGQAVIDELLQKNIPVKAVELNKEVEKVETIKANLLNFNETQKAIQGATHVYLCIGLQYNSKIWSEQWPVLVENIIKACSNTNAKLIFFDNIYMYGPAPLSIPFNETANQNPQSVKGKVRKKIADMVLDAHKANKVEAVIGRSADFYGPNAKNSSLYINFLQNILNDKNPGWIGKQNQKHTYAFTTDNGKALVQLALDDSAYGEVWHLPVGEKIETEKILEIINQELHSNYTISFMPRFLLNILSTFIPILKEVKEVLYQFDNTYEMSWKKFHTKFPDFKVTSYEQGFREMIKSFKNNARSI